MKSMELARQELLWAIESGYIKVKDGKVRVENGKIIFTKSTNSNKENKQ
jgi:hypothetical protein